MSHLDMEMLFQNVPTLCNLEMTFGVKEIGMEYERSLFGMKMSDVTSLQKALRVHMPPAILCSEQRCSEENHFVATMPTSVEDPLRFRSESTFS